MRYLSVGFYAISFSGVLFDIFQWGFMRYLSVGFMKYLSVDFHATFPIGFYAISFRRFLCDIFH